MLSVRPSVCLSVVLDKTNHQYRITVLRHRRYNLSLSRHSILTLGTAIVYALLLLLEAEIRQRSSTGLMNE